jgi:acetolactate synthase-1/2/3 large subunit
MNNLNSLLPHKPVEHRNGADIIAETLVDIGVTFVFCYPGGANLEILDALSRVDVQLIRTEHEQGAVFAAQGYSRASGKLGVCLATSGPGATNLVTGIADANSDSIALLAITGNVSTHWLGRNAFQEVDIVAVTKPITKFAHQVGRVEDISAALRHGCSVACTGRPGPVLLDFPKDIQQKRVAAASDMLFHTETSEKQSAAMPVISQEALAKIADLIKHCEKPVIYAGGGVIAAGMSQSLITLAETLECPMVWTLMGMGSVQAGHPLDLGPLGMHGAYGANVAVNEADFVLALGVRFDDRVIGNPDCFASLAEIVHIDIDAHELGKNKRVNLAVCADLCQALPALTGIARPMKTKAWLHYLKNTLQGRPLMPELDAHGGLTGPQAISILASHLPADIIVTTGVGQHQMWAMQFIAAKRPRSFLSSAGFGTMGFGLPAAIGAKCSAPARHVIDIDGDGSLNMTINELSTCRRYQLGVKIFVVNNQTLGMVRQWQDLIYAGNRVVSSLQDPLMRSNEVDGDEPYPDFLTIAAGYRIASARVRTPVELEAGIMRMFNDPSEPFLLDVMVAPQTGVFPMIPAGQSYRETIFEASGNTIGSGET